MQKIKYNRNLQKSHGLISRSKSKYNKITSYAIRILKIYFKQTYTVKYTVYCLITCVLSLVMNLSLANYKFVLGPFVSLVFCITTIVYKIYISETFFKLSYEYICAIELFCVVLCILTYSTTLWYAVYSPAIQLCNLIEMI